jgi:TRAP-type C4-dicarboxylate transport system substrate-binding protein
MKKRELFMLLGSIGLVFLFFTPSLAQVIRLTFADQNPSIGWGPANALQPWAKKVEEATKNRVKIDIFPAQTLAKGPDIFNAVKTGVADMGWCWHGYWPEMTPLSDVAHLPGLLFKSAEQSSEVVWRLYERFPAIQREFKDVHVLLLYAGDPRFLITNKKQVKTLEDIKGLKIRTPGGPPTEQMKALGAVPILIPMPDNYQAFDKGIIDGCAISWEAIYSFRLYEVVKYYTMAPLTNTYFSIPMNKEKWESLPKDIQEAIMSVSGLEAAKFWGRNFFDTVEAAVVESAKKGGYTINKYTLPPGEAERWVRVSGEPIWKEWVKKMESKGRPEAQQILDAAIEMLKR